jgi:hypothetical protein
VKRLAILFLLLGGLLVSAIGQNPIPTQARHSTPGAKQASAKHASTKQHKSTKRAGTNLQPLAAGIVTGNGATITVHKSFCLNVGQQNTCNGQPDVAFPTTLQFQVCVFTGTNTNCSLQPILDTFDVNIGSNANGVDPSSKQYEFGSAGDTYIICEAPTAGFTALPRPDLSTGGSFQAASEFCIRVTPSSGNVQAQFLNVEHPPTTLTPTATSVPPTATVAPTDTPVPPVPTITPIVPVVVVNTAVPTATSVPTVTSVPPTATSVPPTSTPAPTNTPVPPTNTPVPPTNTPVPPTATAAPAPTDTSVPPVPTNTPKPLKKPTNTPVPTATTAAPPVKIGPAPKPPKILPITGLGGTQAVGHNLAVGRVFRAAHGNVALGITTQPQTGGGSSPMTPILPVILGAMVIGLGALTRRFAFGKI